MQRKLQQELKIENVKKIMGNGCVQINESQKRMDSKWITPKRDDLLTSPLV